MHPLLIPGAHVLRRGPRQLQVGLGPDHAHVVETDATELPAGALPGLVDDGLAWPDDRAVRESLPPATPAPAWARHTLAALARRPHPDLAGRVRRRAAHVVTIAPHGHEVSADLAADLAELCRRTGLRLPDPPRPGPAPRRAVPDRVVAVALGVGEPSRSQLDAWVRDGIPHLVVRLVEGRAVLGPFVVPGRTACLRCLDTYAAEDDPAWPLLVEQYARACRTDRADGIPEPLDAALAAVLVGWAARELATYAEGGDPATVSSTVELSPQLETIETRRWPRHPHCGCGWS